MTIVQSPPDKKLAIMVMEKLMKTIWEVENEMGDKDPHHQAALLGLTMCLGQFMAAVPFEHRQSVCDAAIGYSLVTDGIIDKKRAAP